MESKMSTNSSSTLSEHYYKSRKQLVLFSAILFFWEFIGIKPQRLPVPNINIQLLYPEAIHWALVVVVIYFIYRTMIGWFLSTLEIRYEKISKYDLVTTLLISFLALLIFTVQNGLQIRISTLLVEGYEFEQIISFLIGLPYFNTIRSTILNRNMRVLNRKVKVNYFLLIGFIVLYIIIVVTPLLNIDTAYSVLSFLTGSIVGVLFYIIIKLVTIFFNRRHNPLYHIN